VHVFWDSPSFFLFFLFCLSPHPGLHYLCEFHILRQFFSPSVPLSKFCFYWVFLFCFVSVILRFELRTSCLLGRHSTTWTTLQGLIFVCLFI
jgi:hypothetical protein